MAEYVGHLRKHIAAFENVIPQNGSLTTSEQHLMIEKIKQLGTDAETPLQKIEYGLHPRVAFVIMPLFALSNSGMQIGGDFLSSLANPVSVGVAIGLLMGKLLGVFLFTWIFVRLKFASLPDKSIWSHILGTAMLAGVGFTISLFITGLAFNNQQFVEQSKYGILVASIVAGTGGIFYLRNVKS